MTGQADRREVPPLALKVTVAEVRATAGVLAAALQDGALSGAPTADVETALTVLSRMVDAANKSSGTGSVTRLRPRLSASSRRESDGCTAAELADRLGVTARRVGQLAAAFGLGTKRGGRWWFSDDEAARIERRRAA